MDIPLLLQIAIDRELGIFYHDQFRMTMPPGVSLSLDYAPASVDAVWVTFNMTLGNVPENTLVITHSCSRGMKIHIDPTWYSIGIGAAFEYPLWIYVSQETPHAFTIVNPTAAPVTGDICFWFVEFSGKNFERFQTMTKGYYNLLKMFAEDPIIPLLARNVELLLYLQLMPELKAELKAKYEDEITEEIKRLGIR